MKISTAICLVALSLISSAMGANIGVTPTTWPGTNISGALQTPSALKFRGSVLTFQHPGGEYFMAFEADFAGSTNAYVDDDCPTFYVSVADKATTAAILTAFSTGATFRVQYVKDTSFWNRRAMAIKVFMLEKT